MQNHVYLDKIRAPYYLKLNGYSSIKDVSDKLGFTYNYIAMILEGTRSVPKGMLAKLSRLADVDENKLVYRRNLN